MRALLILLLAGVAAFTQEFDYEAPRAGSYQLADLGIAVDGTVLGTNALPTSLHELFRDRAVILSFIYTRCGDPRACMLATGVLSEIQRLTENDPVLAKKLLLVTLSFDPAFDTPEVMERYGRISADSNDAAEWLFLTTKDQAELKPLLEAYGQRVDPRKKPGAFGPYYHPLRVYMIDPAKHIRNIYSYGLLDPRLVIADARTVLLEQPKLASEGR